MFTKSQRVVVVNPINFGGKSSWLNMEGTVKKVEHGWVHVSLDKATDKAPIPFKERELSVLG